MQNSLARALIEIGASGPQVLHVAQVRLNARPRERIGESVTDHLLCLRDGCCRQHADGNVELCQGFEPAEPESCGPLFWCRQLPGWPHRCRPQHHPAGTPCGRGIARVRGSAFPISWPRKGRRRPRTSGRQAVTWREDLPLLQQEPVKAASPDKIGPLICGRCRGRSRRSDNSATG